MDAKHCTIYQRGSLGNIVKLECRRAQISYAPFAQYKQAIHVRYMGKGQRKERGGVETYRSSLLVLEGWGHPDPPSAFTAPRDAGDGLTVRRSLHSSCSPEWASDFAAKIDPYIEESGARVLWDTRGEVIS